MDEKELKKPVWKPNPRQKVSQKSEKAPIDIYKDIGVVAGVSHDTIATVHERNLGNE